MDIKISNNILTLTVDATIYTEPVLFKCFYWYANTFEVEVFKVASSFWGVNLQPKERNESIDWDRLIQK